MIDETGLQLLGIIPEDLSVVEAVVHGKPIVNAKNAPAAQAFGRVAARFEGEMFLCSIFIISHSLALG